MSITPARDMHLHSVATWNELVRMTNQRIEALNATAGFTAAIQSLPTVSAGDRVRYTQLASMQDALFKLASHVVLKDWLVDGLSDFPVPDIDRFLETVFGTVKTGFDGQFWRFFWPGDPNRPIEESNNPNNLSGVDDDAYTATGYGYRRTIPGDLVGPWIYYDLARVLNRTDLLFRVNTRIATPPVTGRNMWWSSGTANWDIQDFLYNQWGSELSSEHSCAFIAPSDVLDAAYTYGQMGDSQSFSVGLPTLPKKAHVVLRSWMRSATPDSQYWDIAQVGLSSPNKIKTHSVASSTTDTMTYVNPCVPMPEAAKLAQPNGVSIKFIQQNLDARIYVEYAFN